MPHDQSARYWAHAAIDGTAALGPRPGHLAGLTGVLTQPSLRTICYGRYTQDRRCGMHVDDPQIVSAFVYICAHGVHACSSPGVSRGEVRNRVSPQETGHCKPQPLFTPSVRQPVLPQRTLCCPRAAVAPAAGQPAECDRVARSLRAKPQPLHTTTTGSGLQSDQLPTPGCGPPLHMVQPGHASLALTGASADQASSWSPHNPVLTALTNS
jgi:hypothetical protein